MPSVVYFIRAETTGLIKIGWTTDLAQRLSNLEGGSPDRLTLLSTASGGSDLEGHLHEHFADERVHAEWFVPSNRLLDFISRVEHYGDAFIAAGFGHTSRQTTSLGRHSASSVLDDARSHALVLRDGLERRGYSRMAAYDAIARQIGTTSGWVRKLVGRRPDIAVYAHVFLNLSELALSSGPRFAALGKPEAASVVASVVDEIRR
jgi:hypothetical protein